MTRLRHPIRAIREPFGTAGLIVACIALVAALGGTAFAAAKLNSTQKKEVEKIAKKYAGKPGANGSNGTPGANGKDGANGTNGSPGSNGTSATTESFSGNAHGCTAGGVVVKSASPEAVVCNGKNGTNGQTGFTEHLPSGKTETGTWAFNGTSSVVNRSPISFTIPLEVPIDNANECGETGKPVCVVHVFEGETIPAGCTGTVVNGAATELKAEPGNFCAWIQFASVTEAQIFLVDPETSETGVGRAGGILFAPPGATAQGTWAVTAP